MNGSREVPHSSLRSPEKPRGINSECSCRREEAADEICFSPVSLPFRSRLGTMGFGPACRLRQTIIHTIAPTAGRLVSQFFNRMLHSNGCCCAEPYSAVVARPKCEDHD